MPLIRRLFVAVIVLSLVHGLSPATGAEDDFTGYLTVNDEDYGYWQLGRVRIFPDGEAVPLDEYRDTITKPIVFELGHDLAQGLVRQHSQPPQTSSSNSVSESDAVARGGREVEPPTGSGTWVPLLEFTTFGFGEYEGSETRAHLYCDRGPKVWAWLSGPRVDGEDPDDTANRLIRLENGAARLMMACSRTLEVEHE